MNKRAVRVPNTRNTVDDSESSASLPDVSSAPTIRKRAVRVPNTRTSFDDSAPFSSLPDVSSAPTIRKRAVRVPNTRNTVDDSESSASLPAFLSPAISNRTFALVTLITSIALLCACAALVAWVDPYAHYHTVALPLTDTPAYAAPGIARNYEYDTVVLGSSMVENTPVSHVDACLGGQSIKIPMRGGTASDHARVLELCFEAQDLKRVILCMDPTSFAARPDEAAHDRPAYLWNGVGLDDVNYLLNASVLLDKIPAARKNERMLQWYATDRDAMYAWTDVVFSRENALYSYNWNAARYEMKPADYFADRFFANVESCVARFVRAHPNTEFTFYFPPYSVIYWVLQSDAGNLDAQLWMREQFARALLPYENVTLHDFAAYTPWISDLDRYMDYSHHDPQMNAQIIEAIAARTHRITAAEQIAQSNATLLQAVGAFERPY